MVFRISTDLKVQVLQPTAGDFTLNFSLLDSTDVLGGPSATKNWVDIQSEVVSFDFETGVNPGDGFYRPIAATGNLVIRSLPNNPDLNNRIYVGLPIRVQKLSGATWGTIFTANVNSMSTNYTPGYTFPEISLGLTDNLDSLLNTLLVVNYPAQTAYARIAAIQSSLASTGITQLIETPVTFYSQNVNPLLGTFTVQELLEPILQYYRSYSEQTWSDAYASYVYKISDGADVIPSGASGWTLTSETTTTGYQTNYSSLDVAFIPSTIYNQIIISDLLDIVQAQVNNYDSQVISGIQPINSTWDFVNNSSIAPTWAEAVAAETDTRIFSNITIKAINKIGIFNPIVDFLLLPGYGLVNLKQNFYGVNRQVTALVTRQAHNINANGWLVTLDLWKGYTYA